MNVLELVISNDTLFTEQDSIRSSNSDRSFDTDSGKDRIVFFPQEASVAKAEPIASTAFQNDSIDPNELGRKVSSEVLDDGYAGITVDDDSPYAEVRAAVPSTDNPVIPQNTIRMWTLGFIMTTIGSAINMLFSMHSPSIILTTFVTSILAWPLGKAWARFLPDVRIFGKYGGPSLNPGPFNLKEHTLITVMGNVSFGGGNAYATDILLSMNNFYGTDFGWGFGLLAIWSTQCIGFSLAGLAKKILVTPSTMILSLIHI